MEDACTCAVCCDIASAEIWSCIEGHVICEACKNQWNGDCPQCRRTITLRNRPLEAIRDTLERTCACGFLGVTTDYLAHMPSCRLRPIQCPFSTVCRPMSADLLAKHVREDHEGTAMVVQTNATANGHKMVIDAVLDPTFAGCPHFTIFPVRPNDRHFGIFLVIDTSAPGESSTANGVRVCAFGPRLPWTLTIDDASRSHHISTKEAADGNEEIVCATNIKGRRAQLVLCIHES